MNLRRQWGGALFAAWLFSCNAQPRAEARPAQSAAAPQTASATAAARVVPARTPSVLWLPDAAAPKPSIAAAAPPPDAPATNSKPVVYRVAAIGDSLTDARNHGGKYLRHVQQLCPQSVFDNYGVGGEMVNQMRRRFERDVLSKRVGPHQLPYSHVIVFGGVNDLYSDQTANRSNERIQSDLSVMYNAARGAGIKVIALNVAPWGGFTRYYTEHRGRNTLALNRWIAERAQQHEIAQVVDSYALLSCGTPSQLCPEYERPFKDGLHFGPKGHEILGAALYKQAFSDCG